MSKERFAMPRICLDRSALEHNFHIVKRLASNWNFQWLPVLKMVASYPFVKDFLRENGYPVTGTADIDEYLCTGVVPAPDEHVYINITPIHRAGEVVRRFRRSAVSSREGLLALEQAAARAGLRHEALLMIDLGDGREGVPLGPEMDSLLKSIERRPPAHVRIAGIGATLGCMNGLCPDDDIMRRLTDIMKTVWNIIPPPATVSLGGSIFWNWFALHHERFHEEIQKISGWKVELRMGDPLLVGFDMYRNTAFLGGEFRRDVFALQAQVLEVQDKHPQMEGTHVANGHGGHLDETQGGPRVQALLDCGILHTDMTDIKPELPGAELINYSGNYAVLDATKCLQRPVPGDVVRFYPGYWAVARAFRTPQTEKTVCAGCTE